MADYTTSPNMGIKVPTPQQDPGPDYATHISDGLNIIDAHGHTGAPDDGIQIVSAAININADLPTNSHNLTQLRSVRFTNQSATLGSSGDVGCVYEKSGDLYFNNAAGTPVQITSGTAVNVSGVSNSTYAYQSGSSSTIILNTDTFILLGVSTATSATVTLPAANSVAAGRFYLIKDRTGSAATNNIVISRAGSDTIDGATSVTIDANYGEVGLASNGSNGWMIVHWFIGKDPIIAGDVTGTLKVSTVAKANGATVPAAGSLTTGNVLQVSGSSALSYAPINLAGGANYVTGALPTANQVVQTMAGDVTGTTAAAAVVSLTGSANSVAMNANALTYAASVTPSITQSQATSGNGKALTITSQAGFGTGNTNGGALTLKSGAPNGSGTPGLITLQSGGSSSNSTIYLDKTTVEIGGGGASVATIYLEAPQVLLRDNSLNTSCTFTPTIAGASWSMASNVASFSLTQADKTTNGGTGAVFTIQAQNETGTTSTGGNLVLASGTGTSANGSVIIKQGSTTAVTVAPTDIALSSTTLHSTTSGGTYLTSSAAGMYLTSNDEMILETNGNSATINAGTIYLNGTSAGATIRPFNAGAFTMALDTGLTSVAMYQDDAGTASGTGATFTVHAQNETGTTSTGGKLVLKGGTGTSKYGETSIESPLLVGTLAYAFPSDANQTLTAAQSANNIISLSGSLSASRNLQLNRTLSSGTLLIVRNFAGQDVDVYFSTGTAVTCLNNKTTIITAASGNPFALLASS